MYSNSNNALCNTLFSKMFIASAIVQCALLSIVQHVPIPCIYCCLFWCFLTLLKPRPLRMRSRSSTPLNERKKMADEKKDEELTGSFSSTKDDGVLLRREDGY